MKKKMITLFFGVIILSSTFCCLEVVTTAHASDHFTGTLSLDVARGRWKSACDLLEDADVASIIGNPLTYTPDKGSETKTPIYLSFCTNFYAETRVDYSMEIDTEGELGDAEAHSLANQEERNKNGSGIVFESIDALGPGAVWDPLYKQIVVHHANGSMIKTKIYADGSKEQTITITKKLLPLVRLTSTAHWNDL